MRIRLTAFLLAVLLAVAGPASAQEPDERYKYGVPPLDIDTYEIFDGRKIDLPAASTIDAEFLDQTQYEYAACKLNELKFGTADCGCRAMNFLHHRLKMPDDHRQNVVKAADSSMHCMVPEKLEARYLSDCKHSLLYQRMASRAEGDAYCACYAKDLTPKHIALEPGYSYGNRLRAAERASKKACGQ
ncbi:hypothetical protein [Henriciella pelagia]|jgi:hypothetical protein|uniref:Nuclease n=1 Tax=Henriciella pelagia TaxID=1977912 RepID=A0ABQ1JXN4_9PROT|nr:hypothetical protein [Henriciella pelagia]GGB76764.1 hypothetical protein GCM10011503_26920 [Henriciella pelagia]